MKRLFIAIFSLALFVGLLTVPSLAAEKPTSGTCGENLTWSFDEATRTLTISGTGEMSRSTPWNDLIDSISTVTIEEGVTSICTYAFYPHMEKENHITTVNLPNSLKKIDYWGFFGCFELKSITIPEGVRYLGASCFDGTSITSIYIPSTVFSGAEEALNSKKLTEITVDSNNITYSSANGLLLNKEGDKLLFCPKGKTSVTIPDGVAEISAKAFEDCTSLVDVKLPKSIKTISGFSKCTSLTEIIIPEGVTKISVGAFSGCKNLSSVSLPSTLKAINGNAFFECLELKNITFAGNETMWGQIDIADGNQELSLAEIKFTGKPTTPGDPVTPGKPETTPVAVTNGGLGKNVNVTVTGGHWLTVQTRRGGSISITSIRVPGSGKVTVTFSAASGSTVKVWETENQLTFNSSGAPNNTILSTVTREL